ncbi:hypothetical protein [Streptomyces phaeochromogenes]|uniref:hypothetical protein n=1 Tax=Streptomyces phaeochromogenes TaxID=1923 RepID=UPI002DD7D0F4|nr:hypothetical protein [Streptomyces phaeochromogenes]WRZ36613.1 hypothetical protein OG931_14850 [Streptomyces phaeochromogenes]
MAVLTTPAPAPSKPAELAEPVEPPKPAELSKPVGPSKLIEPANPLPLATLAAPTHVTVTEIPGRFAVIRHAVTISRNPGFRFHLWITTTMITSELVHRLTASFA